MLYFKVDQDKVTLITENRAPTPDFICRGRGIPSYEAAQILADAANAFGGYDGGKLVATDATASTSPRYDVIRAPTIGDKVSYSFNGDSYPDGEIVKISDSLRVVKTNTGSVYYRRMLTGSWRKDGTWTLIRGHRNERNPSF